MLKTVFYLISQIYVVYVSDFPPKPLDIKILLNSKNVRNIHCWDYALDFSKSDIAGDGRFG